MDLQLEPYQLEGAAFLASRFRASLFDEPGLGKTAQAIRAKELTGRRKTLVICPAAARQVWPYEVKLWARDNPKVVKASSVFDLVAWRKDRLDILVISYEQATQWKAELTKDFFGVLVVDEAHYCKNPQTRRSAAVAAIAKWAEFVWCLTGTPIKNDPADLWFPLQLSGVTPLSFTAFQRRYFTQRMGTFNVSNTVRKVALPELKMLIAEMSMTRTLEEVGEKLPPIRLDVLPVDGARSDITLYLKQYPGLDQRVLAHINEQHQLSFDDSTHIATLRSLIVQAKAPGYARLITEELKSGTTDKLVIMAHHRPAIELVASHLNANGIRTEIIYGGTSEAQREKTVRSFQDDPLGVRVIVGNITSAGVGLTLTAACKLDMLESSWTAADNIQAIKRVRRKGQTRPTFARFVTLQDSFDQSVAAIVSRKARDTATITGKDNMKDAIAS